MAVTFVGDDAAVLVDRGDSCRPTELYGIPAQRKRQPGSLPSRRLLRHGLTGIGLCHADQYLSVVDSAVPASEPEVAETTMDIGTALDYLSLTLHAAPDWKHPTQLLQLSLLEDAMWVSRQPSSKADFNQQLSSLCTILCQLKTVAGADEQYQARGWNPQSTGSLNNLELWLTAVVPDDEGSWRPALNDLLKLRQEQQHRAMRPATAAATVRSRFGLPDPITD